MFHKCDFFKRLAKGNRVMPYCSYHANLYGIRKTDYPISKNRLPHCPFSSCPHVGDIIEILEVFKSSIQELRHEIHELLLLHKVRDDLSGGKPNRNHWV